MSESQSDLTASDVNAARRVPAFATSAAATLFPAAARCAVSASMRSVQLTESAGRDDDLRRLR